jgi:hypothetical protein
MIKKITFLLLMLSTFMSFAQFSFDFSSTTSDNWIGDSGLAGVSTTTDSPAVDGAIGVVNSSSTGNDWQNAQVLPQIGDYKIDLSGTDKTITFEYYSNETGGGMIKLEGSGATNVQVYFPYNTVDTWETISIEFTEGDGQYTKFVYFPHYGSGEVYDAVNLPKNDTKISYFDNISAPAGDIIQPPATPTTAAPTPPTRNSSDVISIYSDAYNSISLAEFPTGWSQGTHNFITIDGDNTIEATSSEFIGIVSDYGTGTDLTNMEYMHIDYFTASSEGISVKLVNTIANNENIVSLGTTVSGEWKSVDIAMSAFTGVDLSQITQFIIDPAAGIDVYYDNFYFYKEEALSVGEIDTESKGIYPNPTTGLINVAGDIYNTSGQLVLKNSNDLSGLPSGLYFIRVIANGSVSTSKVIKR